MFHTQYVSYLAIWVDSIAASLFVWNWLSLQIVPPPPPPPRSPAQSSQPVVREPAARHSWQDHQQEQHQHHEHDHQHQHQNSPSQHSHRWSGMKKRVNHLGSRDKPGVGWNSWQEWKPRGFPFLNFGNWKSNMHPHPPTPTWQLLQDHLTICW